MHELRARVEEQEVARAVGVLRLAGSKAAWPKVAACWSPRMPAIGTRERIGGDRAEDVGGAPDLGEHRPRHAERCEQVVVPVERREVHEQRAARVRDVGRVHAAVGAAGQVPEHPAVGGAEEQLAASARSRAPSTLSSSQAIFVAEK